MCHHLQIKVGSAHLECPTNTRMLGFVCPAVTHECLSNIWDFSWLSQGSWGADLWCHTQTHCHTKKMDLGTASHARAKSKQAWLCHLGRAVRLGFVRERSSSGSPSCCRQGEGDAWKIFSLRTHQSHPLAAQRTGKLLLKWFADRNWALSKTCAFKPHQRKAASTSTSFIITTRRFTARQEIVFRSKFVFGFYY